MCGICGIFSFGVGNPVDTALIQRMTDQLVHRGPDDAGFYISGDQAFGLGVRRLKIVDADGSHQPITNESSRLWIGCNGEIYNYRSLREQLASNHRFSTDGDVEPILHLYEEFGVGCVDHLRGMFAFALWDNNAQRLLLAVDRFGKKPMYYALDGQKIVFASELKALLQVPGIRRDLDIEALDEYLACGYITAPRSIYLGIRKLPPGHLMSVRRDGNIQFEPYWQPQFAPPDQQDRRSLHDLAAELRALLLESVRLRMMDGAGAFLSGGVDSSAVVALMREVTSAPIKAFSIAFEEPTYDESAYARAVADDFGVEHFVEYVPPNALDLLPKLVKHFDEPFADASMLPTYVVSRLAHQHVRVVLSGDGGDEVFGGYHQHLYGYRQQILEAMIPPSLHSTAAGIARFIPHIAKIKPYAAALGQPSERWLTSGFFSRAQRSALYTTDIRERLAGCEEQPAKRAAFMHTANLDRLSQLQYHDLTVYLPGDIIVKVDRASMMNSLEVRSPLLDHKVFEFMARVPPQHRVSLTNGKTLLKRALADKLPQSVQRRKKQGFSIPQSEWLRSPLKPMLEDLLANSSSLDLFNRAYIERLIREHSDGVCDHKDRLWALLCFELWHHQQ